MDSNRLFKANTFTAVSPEPATVNLAGKSSTGTRKAKKKNHQREDTSLTHEDSEVQTSLVDLDLTNQLNQSVSDNNFGILDSRKNSKGIGSVREGISSSNSRTRKNLQKQTEDIVNRLTDKMNQ